MKLKERREGGGGWVGGEMGRVKAVGRLRMRVVAMKVFRSLREVEL